jgi:nitroreductase
MVSPGLLGNPPAVVAICQDLDEAEKKGSELGRNVVTVMDTAMAAQNIMLAAFAEGVGSCPILSFHAGAVQQILSLPPGVVPQLLISLGFPQTKVKGPERNLKVVWFNEYS